MSGKPFGRKALLLAGVLLIMLCAGTLMIEGGENTVEVPVRSAAESAEAFRITVDQEGEIVRLTEQRLEGKILYLTFRSVARGKAFVEIEGPEDFFYLDTLYVHPLGVLSVNCYFGKIRGSGVIPAAAALFVALLLLYVIRLYREGMRRSIYQYRNVRDLGWIVYLASMLLWLIPNVFSGGSLSNSIGMALSAAAAFSVFAFPAAFIVSLLVAVSSVQLIHREGRNWRNMLALILGLLVCFGTILPYALSEFLQRTTLVDVHNEQGAALYIELAVRNSILVTLTYLECILLSTIILSVKAARRIPAFDKDYILILGCRIQEDGTPTPLLRGRADRAVEFAAMQKQATGRELIFVPSGGRGSDEIISEAESIRNYLLAAGIPPEQIMMEDRSVNTEENIRNSMVLIRERSGASRPGIAFSTTNYHVFRSGIIAERQGIHAEGVGSKTRSYFWINAFVREFIASIYTERKMHAFVIAGLILMMLSLILMKFINNIV